MLSHQGPPWQLSHPPSSTGLLSCLQAQAGAVTCWNPVAQHVASQKPGQVLSLVAPRAIPKQGHAGSPYSRWQPFGLVWVSPVKPGLHRSQRSCSLHMCCPVTGSQGAPSTAPSGSHSQAERNGHHSRNKEGKQGVIRRLWKPDSWFKSLIHHLLSYNLTTLVKVLNPSTSQFSHL